MQKQYQAIFFDLDGTLIDSVEEITACTNDWLSEIHQPHVTRTQVESWIGEGAAKFLRKVLAHLHYSTDEVHEHFDHYLKRFSHYYQLRSGTLSTPYEHVRETLDALQQHYNLGLVTNKRGDATAKTLQKLDLEKYFSVVIAGDTLPVCKPNPEPLEAAIKTAGASADTSLFIGDSITDLNTGIAAKVDTWVFTHGYHQGMFDNLENLEHKPDRILRDALELKELLRGVSTR